LYRYRFSLQGFPPIKCNDFWIDKALLADFIANLMRPFQGTLTLLSVQDIIRNIAKLLCYPYIIQYNPLLEV